MTLPNILGKEFVCINKIIGSLPVGGTIGDDCAVVKWGGKNLLITVDTFVEKVHFDLGYFSLDEIGQRCCEASISDIAAMGGKALYVTLSVSVPDHGMIQALTQGVKKSLLAHKIKLIGGDTTYSDKIILSLTVLGEAKRPVYRSGARKGDSVYLSSCTGLSEGGLCALKKNIAGFKALKKKHKTPISRLDIAGKIAEHASAMIDISDGLASELYHLAHASGISIVLDKIPLHPELKKLGSRLKIDPRTMACYGGEDFELLYTVPASRSGAHKLPGIRIGEVVTANGTPAVYIKTSGGNMDILPPNIGFKHFI